MPFHFDLREHTRAIAHVAKWCAIAVPTSAAIGSACALFLWLLAGATRTQWSHPWLLYLLPLAGVAIDFAYRTLGGTSERGNNLIMDEIHEPGAGVPIRMAPLVLAGTVVTHLFGGSAGREGTAVQIGGSFAQQIGRWLKLSREDVRVLLMVGIAAGFGGVFGTPVAACVFAIEVAVIGRLSYDALIPCLIAGIVGDRACVIWGIHHTAYEVAIAHSSFDGLLAGKVALAAVAFGLASVLFAELTHGLSAMWRSMHFRGVKLARPIVGALTVIGLVHLIGSRDYLGLGVDAPPGGHVSIVNAFHLGGADAWSWFWKILFTAITLSSGFKGGEVTPLFFIGATLGNVLGGWMNAPVDLMAAAGFVAVFAGATNTPLACTIMGVELFGASSIVYLAIACFVAYLFSGHTGIYPSQRIGVAKIGRRQTHEGKSLGELRHK